MIFKILSVKIKILRSRNYKKKSHSSKKYPYVGYKMILYCINFLIKSCHLYRTQNIQTILDNE